MNSWEPARTDMPGVNGTGLDGSKTHDTRFQVPLVDPASRTVQRSPTYSNRQWILETLANAGSEIWMPLA
eukprot:CAMPEP_0206631670 /NCGR_PEP_ID=MMETSP0325_2-20121206/68386_1 /ASSEMBLY_ACC=CAM_ASM_000347 /TAXON_ID=2866 /ORGANISM="Crypthecodinium cohnii, Strain Seligo" /LENGTH=69 /DNA_ID=CAMNT_0054156923 /DNA_START=201 /DNA_END=406 /DNA_ORIENTATION=-